MVTLSTPFALVFQSVLFIQFILLSQQKTNCYKGNGRQYRGKVSITSLGSICKKWTDPKAVFNPNNFPNLGLGDHNYCRNPDNDLKPWCWTIPDSNVFGYCNVPKCFNESISTRSISCASNEVACKVDKKCVVKWKICDKKNDCSDGSDEKNCLTRPQEVKYRLIGSENSYEGRFEIKHNGDWKMLCNSNFTKLEANAACRQLGFSKGAESLIFMVTQVFGLDNGIFAPTNFSCATGQTLDKCKVKSNPEMNSECYPNQAVGLRCIKLGRTCSNEEFKCVTDKICINQRLVCDGKRDCQDGSDETGSCQLKVSLENGKNKFEGRVSIRRSSVFGTVCKDEFDNDDASVLCRMAFPNDPLHKHGEYIGQKYGQGAGMIVADDLQCSGNETNLTQCAEFKFGYSDCDHSEDVSIRCGAVKKSVIKEQKVGGRAVTPECGLRFKESLIEGRVVGGRNASKDEIPWQVGIRRIFSAETTAHHCGGVILNNFWIISAAHCFNYLNKKKYYKIVVGDFNNEKPDKSEQIFEVSRIIVHPEFNARNQDFDYALIKIKPNEKFSQIEMTSSVQLACLPSGWNDLKKVVESGQECIISGWGIKAFENNKRLFPKVLQTAKVPLIKRGDCNNMYSGKITKRMLCAGKADGMVDTCQGDSGGPLICEIDTKFTVFGIASWGKRCGDKDSPGVYANILKLKKWIEQKISS